MIVYKKYNSKYWLFEGDRSKFKNVCKQVEGRWLRDKGWVIPVSKKDTFTKLLEIAFPDVVLVDVLPKEEPLREEPPREEPPQEEEPPREEEESLTQPAESEFVPNPVMSEDSVHTIHRARSAKKSRSRIKPRDKMKLLTSDTVALSSSSEEDSGSESSPDYPARSPSRKGYINNAAISKMNMASRRLMELELGEK